MSNITKSVARVSISMRRRAVLAAERASAAVDYLALALIVAALMMTIFKLVSGDSLNGVLTDLIVNALTEASKLIKVS